jgi:hypothetical protein
MAVANIDQTRRNQMHRNKLPTNWREVASGFQGFERRRRRSRTGVGNLSTCDDSVGKTPWLGVGSDIVVCSTPTTGALVLMPVGRPKESRSENPAHVPAVASVASMSTVGAKAMPAALRRIHHGKASLHMIS